MGKKSRGVVAIIWLLFRTSEWEVKDRIRITRKDDAIAEWKLTNSELARIGTEREQASVGLGPESGMNSPERRGGTPEKSAS